MQYAYNIFTSSYSKLHHNTWIADSGASQHMTYNKTLLHYIVLLSIPVIVSLPYSYQFTVNYIGSLFLTPELELHDVLFVPVIKHNLLSVSLLCTVCLQSNFF